MEEEEDEEKEEKENYAKTNQQEKLGITRREQEEHVRSRT